MSNKYYLMPEETLKNLFQYLANRPYVQVCDIMGQLKTMPQCEESQIKKEAADSVEKKD